MPKRSLKMFDPRAEKGEATGIRMSRETLAWLEATRLWLLQQLWSNEHLRPTNWNGKLTQDEALRMVLRGFAEAYGAPREPRKDVLECHEDPTLG